MAKKQQQTAKVLISGEVDHTYSALYKYIELKPGGLQFLHLERKGNTWLLLDSLTCNPEPWEMSAITYHREGPVPQLGFSGVMQDIGVYTVISLPDEAFYHLDEMPDGKWRITHSVGLLQCDHKAVQSFVVQKV